MAAAMSGEAAQLLRLLEDGQWQALDEIRRRLGAAVAPGKALRRYEQNEANRALHHGPRVGPELSDDEKIASGRRAIATDVIHSLKKRYVEVQDSPDGCDGMMVRRRAEVVPMVNPRRKVAVQTAEQAAEQATEQTAEQTAEEMLPAQLPPPESPAPASDSGAAGEPAALDLAGNPAVAFFDAEQVRGLIAEAVQQAVDRAVPHAVGFALGPLIDDALNAFQRGMQHWLIGRFAELERQIERGQSGAVNGHRPPERRHRPQRPSDGALPRALRRM